MSKALFICYRRPLASPESDDYLSQVAARLFPDHIVPRPPIITRADGIVSVIANPAVSVRRDGASFALGVLEHGDTWSMPRAPVPDGCFALFRADGEHVELVADAAATRTIWYALTDDLLVASTSQRAVVTVLGDFQPNREACAWLLSSGALGPGRGWDARVARVPPAGRVLLRRGAWRLEVREPRMAVSGSAPEPGSASGSGSAGSEAVAGSRPRLESRAGDLTDSGDQQRELETIVDDVVGRLDLDSSRWLVPLSGGVDSRGVLLALRRAGRQPDGIRCITWGRRDALDDPRNDASIARQLAQHLGVAHEYLVVEATAEPRERFLERFLVVGEGRIDSIGGYVDGFEVWKRLYESGIEGIVRGDEAFGWKPVRTERDVRDSVHLTVLEDVLGARAARELGLPTQQIPEALAKRADESLEAWRDRLYQQFRLPVVLAALTDLKTPYVEVVNPLLYARVLAYARRLPDALRTDKQLWSRAVAAWGPDIPYATRAALPQPRPFMEDGEMLALTLDELGSARTVDLFGAAAVERVRASLESSLQRLPMAGLAARRSRLGRLVRKAKKRFLGRLHVDPFALAFRMVIASRMCKMLRTDAAASAAEGAAAIRAAASR